MLSICFLEGLTIVHAFKNMCGELTFLHCFIFWAVIPDVHLPFEHHYASFSAWICWFEDFLNQLGRGENFVGTMIYDFSGHVELVSLALLFIHALVHISVDLILVSWKLWNTKILIVTLFHELSGLSFPLLVANFDSVIIGFKERWFSICTLGGIHHVLLQKK